MNNKSTIKASEEDAGKVQILGVSIAVLTLEMLLERIGKAANIRRSAIFDYANIHAINMAFTNPDLKDFYNECDTVFCDGIGVMWGARLLGRTLSGRFTPPDWIDRLAEQCVERRHSMFFLGGQPGVADRAAARVAQRHHGLLPIGIHHGYFDMDITEENQRVIDHINHANPDILFVGFGIPLQERWLQNNALRINAPVLIACGAMFDYLARNVHRGPRWMTDHGLEWLSRLLIEPRRLWSRYLIGIPLFFIRVFRQRFGLLKA
jgi:N-acetylglucosaminyldiphosphoundecaprenol N-acetyl-beta-D-mannosaminyltransferase